MNTEPALTVASITAVIAAAIALFAAFGLPITQDQTEAILGFVAVAAPIVVGFVVRSRVTPIDRSAARRR